MEKITTLSINHKEYKFMESAHQMLSDYNSFLKRTIKDKNRLNDIEIQISVLLDLEIENKGDDKIVTEEVLIEVISVLKDNQKIYYRPQKRRKPVSEQYTKQNKKKRKNRTFKLRRDSENNILGGVCSGIEKRIGINTVLLRVLFIAGAFFKGFMIPAYIVLWIIIPSDKNN